jgi:hypothetical protein
LLPRAVQLALTNAVALSPGERPKDARALLSALRRNDTGSKSTGERARTAVPVEAPAPAPVAAGRVQTITARLPPPLSADPRAYFAPR